MTAKHRPADHLAAVDLYLLAVGQHDALEPDDFLAVVELIADTRDHVARLDCRLGPAVPFHPAYCGPTDHPLLRLAVFGPNLEGDHRVRVFPAELHHRALHRDELVITDRPRVMCGKRDYTGDQRKNDNCRHE